jgi:uncharacterized protein (TIGR03067 family)
MTRKVLVVLAVGLLFAADAKEKDKTDDDKILGTWLLTSEEEGGSSKQAEGKKITVTFAAEGKAVVKYGIGDRPDRDFTFQLDATRKPNEITIMGTGETFAGIYKLDGDMLTVCMGQRDGAARPAEFATRDGDGLVLVVLKREKK